MIPEGLPDARRRLRTAIRRHIRGGSTDRRDDPTSARPTVCTLRTKRSIAKALEPQDFFSFPDPIVTKLCTCCVKFRARLFRQAGDEPIQFDSPAAGRPGAGVLGEPFFAIT